MLRVEGQYIVQSDLKALDVEIEPFVELIAWVKGVATSQKLNGENDVLIKLSLTGFRASS